MYYFHTDLNGTPLDVTDSTGKLCWSGKYSAWGKVTRQNVRDWRQSTVSQFPQPLRYPGQYSDEETGLHYNTFRYYDPDVGRFTTQDPVGLLGGINLYAYAPNPLIWIDPWGYTGTYIFTDGVVSYIGKGPLGRMVVSMGQRIGGSLNAIQSAHLDFKSDKLGFMVEHRLMETYNARLSTDFANSSKLNSPGKKLYDAADTATKKKVDRLASKLNDKFKASKGGC